MRQFVAGCSINAMSLKLINDTQISVPSSAWFHQKANGPILMAAPIIIINFKFAVATCSKREIRVCPKKWWAVKFYIIKSLYKNK